MVKVTIKNTSEKDITDYRIAEAKLDNDGNVIYDKNGGYKDTGRSLEWSIKSGETLKFPKYAADYLRNIYPFLEEVESEETAQTGVVPSEPEKEVTQEAKSHTGSVNCAICGKHFTSVRGLGLHFGHNHPSELMSINR